MGPKVSCGCRAVANGDAATMGAQQHTDPPEPHQVSGAGGLVDSLSAEIVLGELPASCGVPDLANDDEVMSACWRISAPSSPNPWAALWTHSSLSSC